MQVATQRYEKRRLVLYTRVYQIEIYLSDTPEHVYWIRAGKSVPDIYV